MNEIISAHFGRSSVCLTATAVAVSLAAAFPAAAQVLDQGADSTPTAGGFNAHSATSTPETEQYSPVPDDLPQAQQPAPHGPTQTTTAASSATDLWALYGWVQDGRGAPVPFAKVKVCPSTPPWRPDRTDTNRAAPATGGEGLSEDCHTGSTTEQGEIYIEVVPSESIDVTITQADYHRHEETMTWEKARESFDFTLEPISGYPAHGTVIEGDRPEIPHGVSDATVWLCTPQSCHTQQSGTQGGYYVTGFGLTEFWAKAYRPDIVTGLVRGHTKNYDPDEFEEWFYPRGAVINATILDVVPSRVWIDGVDVLGTVPVMNRGDYLHVKTHGCPGGSFSYVIEEGAEDHDSIGYFTETSHGVFEGSLPTPDAADYQKILFRDQCHHEEFFGETRFGIRYVNPTGTVTDSGGSPIAGATVTLERLGDHGFAPIPAGSEFVSPENRETDITTAADGSFRWETGPGTYRVKVSAPGYVSAATGESAAYSPQWVELDQPADMQVVLQKAPETKLAPTLTVASPGDDLRVGEPTDVTVTVTGDDLTPTGTVSVSLGDEAVPGCQAIALSGEGTATCSVSFPTAGEVDVVASYSGNAIYEPGELVTGLPVGKGHQVVGVGTLQGIAAGSTETVRITSNAPEAELVVSSRNVNACTVRHLEGDLFEVTGVAFGVCSLQVIAPETNNWKAGTPFVAGMGVIHPGGAATPVSGFVEVTRTDGADTVASVPLTVAHPGQATVVAAVTTVGAEVTAITGGGLEWVPMAGYTHDGVATSYWTADTDQPITDLTVTAQLDNGSATSTIAITVT